MYDSTQFICKWLAEEDLDFTPVTAGLSTFDNFIKPCDHITINNINGMNCYLWIMNDRVTIDYPNTERTKYIKIELCISNPNFFIKLRRLIKRLAKL